MVIKNKGHVPALDYNPGYFMLAQHVDIVKDPCVRFEEALVNETVKYMYGIMPVNY